MIDFFIWLAIAVSLGVILVLFVAPIAVFGVYAVLCIVQDAWAEAARWFRVGR